MRIQRELRVPAMEKSVNVTIDADYAGLVIPSDLIELIRIVPANTDDDLRKVNLARALKGARVTGDPSEYARQGGLYILAASPKEGDVIRIDYYSELQPLVNPSDTNVISIIAWDLIINAALVQACIYYKDKRAVDFEQQYQTIQTDLQNQADLDEEHGGAEVMPCYSMSFPDFI